MKWRALLLVVPCLFLLGGRTNYVGKHDWVHYLNIIDENSVATRPAYVAPCISNPLTTVAATDVTQSICHTDPSRPFQLTRWGVVLTEAMDGATESCSLTLETADASTTAPNAGDQASIIEVGVNNDGIACSQGTVLAAGADLDVPGEWCMQDLPVSDATTVDKGGWFTVQLEDGTTGGNTCGTVQALQLIIWGYYP